MTIEFIRHSSTLIEQQLTQVWVNDSGRYLSGRLAKKGEKAIESPTVREQQLS